MNFFTLSLIGGVTGAEWFVALSLLASLWLLNSQGRYALLGLPLFAIGLVAGIWVSLITGHPGMAAEVVILSFTSLCGVLKGRKGWLLKKVSAK